MNTLVKILLLLTASSYALALCGEKCSKTLSCKDIHTCLVQNCSTFSAVDLPDNCKCNGKCKEEFDTVYIRKDNCLFLQRLKTCFQKESCDSQYVPELKKFEQDCTNCEPNQCNEEKCLSQLNCFTNSSRGACRSAADVQKVLNSTSKTMYNVWFLPEKCACAAKCAYVTLRFIPSCKGYEQTKKCWDANNCVKDTSSWNMAPCQCDFACSTELSKAKAATEHSEKCKAQKEFNLCAEKFGCKQRPIPIQNIDCSDHSGSGTPYFGSKLLPAAFIATTILFAFITTNLFMA